MKRLFYWDLVPLIIARLPELHGLWHPIGHYFGGC